MSYDTIILALKIAAAGIAGSLGIAGVIFNFKETSGRLNNWGVFVIIGILLSSLLAAFGSIVESQKTIIEAKEQSARTNQLLAQLNRSIQPITKLDIVYWVRLPSDDSRIARYGEKIIEIVKQNTEELLSVPPGNVGGLDATAVGDDEILRVQVKPDTQYWPDEEFAFMGNFASFFNFSVYIREEPIKPEEFHSIVSVDNSGSDFIALGFPLIGENSIDVDIENKEVHVFGKHSYDENYWKSNGSIASMPDLLGAQIFLVPIGAFRLPEKYEELKTHNLEILTRNIEIKTIMLQFAEGRELWIDGNRFRKSTSKFGRPVFSINLPTTEDEMRELIDAQ